MSFKGKVVLITGASSGIGAATAKHFAKEGAFLALNGRNRENLEHVCQQCEELSQNRPLMVLADISVERDAEMLVKSTLEHFGRLDVLVNNAGILDYGSIETTSLHQFDKIMNTNIRAAYHLTMLSVPHLLETEGNVVNVSSLAGIRSFPSILAYCMSKASLDQFTRCAALDLAPKRVRVNAVNPGVIVTDIHRRMGMDEKTYEEYIKRAKLTHPLGRAGEAEEVAQVIAFLASEAASNITGTTVSVDGGKHAMCPR